MEYRYLEGGRAYEGNQMVAGVQALASDFSRKGAFGLPRACRALKGWTKLVPNMSRPPHAFAVITGVVVRLAQLGRADMAQWTLIALGGYLRPGECMRLRGRDLVPPIGPMMLWSLVVCSSEMEEFPSKTGEYDDTIVWDHGELQFMNKVFAELRKKEEKCLWDFSYPQLRVFSSGSLSNSKCQHWCPTRFVTAEPLGTPAHTAGQSWRCIREAAGNASRVWPGTRSRVASVSSI